MSFIPKSSYSKTELIDCSNGKLFTKSGDGRLPSDNMLMFDEILNINSTGGEFGKGSVVANFSINPNLWFFNCHFKKDPVMPGCLGLDAMWQLRCTNRIYVRNGHASRRFGKNSGPGQYDFN